MKYFVPAWYNQGSWWEDKTKPYYSKRLVKEFDDMISLMNMHVKNDETFEMLILNYSPDLRTFCIDLICLKHVIGLYLTIFRVLSHGHHYRLISNL